MDGKAGASKQYTGIWDCVTKTVKNRGFFGLYRGLSVLIYGSIPKSAVRFGSFEKMKALLADSEGKLTTQTSLLAGLCAGATEAIFAVTPMETIKVKFINDQRSANPKYKGFIHGVTMITKEYGIFNINSYLYLVILFHVYLNLKIKLKRAKNYVDNSLEANKFALNCMYNESN